jgi:hypothetical protein
MSPNESAVPASQHEIMVVRLLVHISSIFERLPALVGFSVQERVTLSAGREAARLDAELSVADVSLNTWPGESAPAPGEEIAAALAELLEGHPAARKLLRGFTFARALH